MKQLTGSTGTRSTCIEREGERGREVIHCKWINICTSI